jgi:hypothetical protein
MTGPDIDFPFTTDILRSLCGFLVRGDWLVPSFFPAEICQN